MVKRLSSIWLIISIIFFLIIMLNWLRPQSRLLLTLLPPSDLYKPLVKKIISLRESNIQYEIPIKHLYTGTYFVGVYFQNPSPFGTQIKSNAELELKFIHNRDIIFSDKYLRWIDRFGGQGKEESGVILGYYKVPENIPMDLSVNAVVTVITPDQALEDKYGPIEFFIKRSVDQ